MPLKPGESSRDHSTRLSAFIHLAFPSHYKPAPASICLWETSMRAVPAHSAHSSSFLRFDVSNARCSKIECSRESMMLYSW